MDVLYTSFPSTVTITSFPSFCVILIKDGKVTMKEADCKDKICADHKAIEKSGETIVCLPHKVVIEIRSEDGKEQELDGVTQ